ncbi:twin-arginine translocase subunit TatC [Coraliomargarita sinensis]|uniref:Sec-independent protein translocase protein TatC n=1 Tax=Coraliomargarita sinensis TaxID=2174842 RepID=A0A317ZHC8_9BACT|nr:twin-arginine translocase subunit TatC [Coraliomargarita sinensis]PXA03219.1 twin-arginine translocase subunit TatC [Coraliomargarita sinensis]
MSDDRPEKDDENFEESEPTNGAPEDERPKKPDPDSGQDDAASDDKKADDSSSPIDDIDEAEKFDEIFDEETDPDLSDYYYDEIEDYGLDEYDVPRKPRSAAGRFLTRERRHEGVQESGDDSEDEDSDEEGMSFLEHLEEFRWTIGRSVIAFIIGVAVVVIFHKTIAEWIQMPLNKAYGSAEVAGQNLITYKAMGVISVFFQIALLGGLTLSMPFMLYFLGSFVAPGLTEKERKVLRPACYAAFLLFLIGVSFAFFIILPLALGFTVRLNEHLGFDILWAASDYYNMVVWFSLAIGFFFQFPLVVVLLVYMGVLNTETLKRVRRMVFVGLMIFSALVSPGGDPISLATTTGFMYGLYELAIWTGMRIERKKREEEDEALE